MEKYHVAIAAEALAAAALARAGYEVSVQYGANQPGYDLVAVKGRRMLKVNVKGSQVGGWALLSGYKKGRTWHGAADAWRKDQPRDVVMFLIEFKDVPPNAMPPMFLAKPAEIARFLKKGRRGRGATCLHISRYYKKGIAKGLIDKIPANWACSNSRIKSV
jgi:Holliday junction resolvase-like predicted endonuclease